MRKTCSLGILLVWVCAAQDGPRSGQEIDSIQAALLSAGVHRRLERRKKRRLSAALPDAEGNS